MRSGRRIAEDTCLPDSALAGLPLIPGGGDLERWRSGGATAILIESILIRTDRSNLRGRDVRTGRVVVQAARGGGRGGGANFPMGFSLSVPYI